MDADVYLCDATLNKEYSDSGGSHMYPHRHWEAASLKTAAFLKSMQNWKQQWTPLTAPNRPLSPLM